MIVSVHERIHIISWIQSIAFCTEPNRASIDVALVSACWALATRMYSSRLLENGWRDSALLVTLGKVLHPIRVFIVLRFVEMHYIIQVITL